MRKNRKKQPIGKLIIIASSIITLNLFGISYANWNDNMDMAVSISTGFIQPYFIGDESKMVGNSNAARVKGEDIEAKGIEDDKSMGEITARFINSNTLEITGWCYPNYSENIFVSVGNSGSIPIIYKGIEAEDDDGIIKQIQFKGSNVKEDDGEISYIDQDMIETEDEEDIKIHIQAKNGDEPGYGTRSFTYQLQFEQGLR